MARKDKGKSQPMVKIAVKEPDPAVDPVVVSFPSGLPKGLNAEEANVDATPPPLFSLHKLNEKKKRGRSVVGKDDTCIYQAQNKGMRHDGRRTKLCVGVYDKKAGTLTLHQAAEKGTVYALKQSVAAYKDDSSAALPTHMTAMERRRALFESFGSAKKRRVLKSQEANVVNVESVVGAGSVMMGAVMKGQAMSESNRKAMEETKNGTKTDAVEVAYAEARRKFLPRYDADAKEPHLIYDARDIAGDDAWGQASRVVDACMHKDNWLLALTSRGKWFDSVQSSLQSVPSQSPGAKYQIKCAVLLNHLISFHTQSKRSFMKGSAESVSKFMRLPLEVTTRFLELFAIPMTGETGREGYATSKQNKDKCLVHILLLYLMANGREMKVGDINPVAKDVKMELSSAANLLRAAGCTIKKSGSNMMSAALTVPLKFPPPKRGRGQKS